MPAVPPLDNACSLARIARPIVAIAAAIVLGLASAPAAVAAEKPPAALREGALRGDTRAQRELGDWLAAGRGGRADWRGALFWWGKAARRGDATALARLATSLEHGRGGRKDPSQAWRYWLAAAHGPDGELRLRVARRLLRGEGVRRDRGLGRRLLTFSAVRGDRRAQHLLGESLVEAPASPADRLSGLRWLARAAKAGHPGSAALWTRWAGRLDDEGRKRAAEDALALGLVPPPAPAAATGALEQAAAHDPALMMRLAESYLDRGGAARRRDPSQAIAWLQRAAARGRSDAMLALGVLTGPEGEGPRDEAGSLAWLRRAARAGLPEAMRRLGDRLAVPTAQPAEAALARRWYEAAAARGDAEALARLAWMCEHGVGGAAEPVAAASWWSLAARRGHAGASDGLRRALAALGAGEREAAERRAAAWALRHPVAGLDLPAVVGGDGEQARLQALAEAGAAWAQTALAHALARGRFGSPDPAEAATWWLRAAAQGDRLAQANLVDVFAHGRGVPRDDVIAYGWWCLANGLEPGERRGEYPYAARLTSEAIAEATRQVANWRRRFDDLPPDPPLPAAAGREP